VPKSEHIAIREIQTFGLQRKVVAHITSSSWTSTPHVTYLYEPDITDFHAAFRTLTNERSAKAADQRKISFNTVLLRAIVEGLLVAPRLNSLLEYNPRTSNGRLRVCADINICLPWLVADGRMITPIIAKADRMSLDDMAEAVAAIAGKIERTNIDELLLEAAYAKAAEELRTFKFGMIPRILMSKFGRRGPARLRGAERKRYYSLPRDQRLTKNDIMDGTVTISNVGSLYREQRGFFGLIEVVPPQVLAVGISAVQEKPGIFVDRGNLQQIGIRKFIPMCLTFDHRAVDFDALVPFLRRMDEIFARPQELFTW
jgi:pyruvate dehydrogenase E2 component (dihydrolipoamide acetyltransferase)